MFLSPPIELAAWASVAHVRACDQSLGLLNCRTGAEVPGSLRATTETGGLAQPISISILRTTACSLQPQLCLPMPKRLYPTYPCSRGRIHVEHFASPLTSSSNASRSTLLSSLPGMTTLPTAAPSTPAYILGKGLHRMSMSGGY